MGDNIVRFPMLQHAAAYLGDSFRNFLAGFGVEGRDKTISHEITFSKLDPDALNKLYRGDWVSRKIVDLPAFDSTRAWRNWQAEQDQIEKLEEEERKLGLQLKLMQALIKARLYGGAALLMGVDGQGGFDTELDATKVSKDALKFVHVVDRHAITAGAMVRDITSPWYGQPSYYMRSNSPIAPAPGIPESEQVQQSSLGYEPGAILFIHPSRVIRLTGLDYPSLEGAEDSWSDSVLQTVYEAVRNASLVSSSISAMISEAKLDIIKVPGLTQYLATDEGSQRLYTRFAGANVAKSIVNATLIDKEEEWDRINLQMANMDKVMAMYLHIRS